MDEVVRRLKGVVWSGLERCGFRLVRVHPGSPVDPDWYVRPERHEQLGFNFVLGEYLLRRDQSRPFFFIQIGAFDGVTDDPIHEYVRRFGWHGVLLEPQLRYFKLLEENYRGCPGLVLLPAALDWKPGVRTLYTIKDSDEVESWMGAVASFSREMLLTHRDLPPNVDRLVAAEPVEAITFDMLLDRAKTTEIDLIQIDAEGYDLEILRMIDLGRVRPPLVRFEHRLLSRREYRAATTLLAERGYQILPELFDTCAYLEPRDPPWIA